MKLIPMTLPDVYEIIHRRMLSDVWWVVIEYGTDFSEKLEKVHYLGDANELYQAVLTYVPGLGSVAVSMFHKTGCSPEEMQTFMDANESTTVVDQNRDVILPYVTDRQHSAVIYIATYFAQDGYPETWPTEEAKETFSTN